MTDSEEINHLAIHSLYARYTWDEGDEFFASRDGSGQLALCIRYNGSGGWLFGADQYTSWQSMTIHAMRLLFNTTCKRKTCTKPDWSRHHQAFKHIDCALIGTMYCFIIAEAGI
jgi:hypothetical protein